jgi:hypothetical protein
VVPPIWLDAAGRPRPDPEVGGEISSQDQRLALLSRLSRRILLKALGRPDPLAEVRGELRQREALPG